MGVGVAEGETGCGHFLIETLGRKNGSEGNEINQTKSDLMKRQYCIADGYLSAEKGRECEREEISSERERAER